MKNEIKKFIECFKDNQPIIEQLSSLKQISNVSLVENILQDIDIIEQNWDFINKYMNKVDKGKKLFKTFLSNLGDYSEIYKDNIETKTVSEAIYIRYKNREKRKNSNS